MASKEQFRVLLCGRKEVMDRLQRVIPLDGVHFQFASSPSFLVGRALFKTPHLVLMEVETDGIQLRSSLKEFCSQHPHIPILAIAGSPDHSLAVDLVKLGASAYFLFPDEQTKIADQISILFNEWTARRMKDQFVALQKEAYDFRQIIGDSPLLRTTIERARKVIKNSAMTVLITGETGTGKELFARAIHYNGKHRNSPFVDIACSALPETLLESELFGHEKGAFTDAKERKIGLFELAGDGTIFLDEIGDISPAMQSKLLKVIEDRTMRRVGGVRDIPVRARIIAATSVDLEAKMEAGQFRRDLYHRLKILPLELPSLRERKEDIPRLASSFLKAFNHTYGKRIKGITPGAIHILMDHEWEGNVRELKHAIERAVLLEEGEWLSENDFDFGTRNRPSPSRKVVTVRPDAPLPADVDAIMLMIPLPHASLNEVQRMLVRKVLDHVGGSKVNAARILKISRPRLDRILRDDSPDT